MAVKSVIEAVREAIREEMQRDPTVFVMGEDVGAAGACSSPPRASWKSSAKTGSSTPRWPKRP